MYRESAWSMSVNIVCTEYGVQNKDRNELFKKKEKDAENHTVNEIKKKKSRADKNSIPGGWGDQPWASQRMRSGLRCMEYHHIESQP